MGEIIACLIGFGYLFMFIRTGQYFTLLYLVGLAVVINIAPAWVITLYLLLFFIVLGPAWMELDSDNAYKFEKAQHDKAAGLQKTNSDHS